jgi:hypothetical protein
VGQSAMESIAVAATEIFDILFWFCTIVFATVAKVTILLVLQ